MPNRPALVLALLAFAAAALAQPAPAPADVPAASAADRRIVVTYFHGDLRCATCKKLEAYAREAITAAFAAELASGRLAFKAVNTDRPENQHFIKDYSLVTKALVVTEEADGTVLRWTNLDRIWTLVRDKAAYTDYVVTGVRAYLGPAS